MKKKSDTRTRVSRVAIEELKKILKKNRGKLYEEDIIDAAKPKDSPLHCYFTWDNDKAAEKCRIIEARKLIRIVVETPKGFDKPMRVFVSLTTDREEDGGYRMVTTVLSDRSMRAQMLQDALDDLRILEAKYSNLTELAGVFKEYRKLIK